MPSSADTINDIAAQISDHSCVTYLDDVQLSDGLLSGPIKNAAVVACSDMGTHVPFICSAPDVQLFSFQNFGHRSEVGGMLETIAEIGIEHVIVYGHSGCEYTKFRAKSEDDRNAEDEEQCRLYVAAVESDSEADWKIAGQYNVLNELKKMLAEPTIASRVADGRLRMHGWFYNSATKQLEVFDPQQKVFRIVTR